MYVGSVKLSDRLSVLACICMQLSAIRLSVKLYIGTSLVYTCTLCTCMVDTCTCACTYSMYMYVHSCQALITLHYLCYSPY